MFKILFIGVLVYVFYRLVMPAALPQSEQDILDDTPADEDEFIDYEELE